MANLDSFHFRLYHKSGGTILMPGLVIQEAEGDIIKPDKISVRFSGTIGGFALKSGLVTLGEESYMTNPLSGQWERVPKEVSPLGFFDPRQGIAAMTSQIEQVTLRPDGKEIYRITGRLPAQALAPLVGDTAEEATIAVELVIDANRLYVVEAQFEGRVTPDEPEATVRVITLSRFNEPVTIEPPQ
jgi:hypothetical protein